MTQIPPPKFEDLMKRYHGEIARNTDAAWIACPVKEKEEIGMPNNPENTCCNSCRFKQKIDEELFECSLVFIMRWIIGDDLYCTPCERTMPECGACKGPAPKCPKCGGPTFRANIDDQDMILCYNDACKWKGRAEIGGCPHGERIGGMIRCVLAGSCPYQKPNAINDGSCWYVCTREVAALAACEQYQQEENRR